jgi:hypothetical protein
MPLFRRFGRPGLLGTVERTAVIAGTATVTARAIGQDASLIEQLKSLSDLKTSGAISEDEFAKAKRLLLAAR